MDTRDDFQKRIDQAGLVEDHYTIMGLEDLRHAASESEIKKSYRKLVLRFHPDKTANADESTEETFRVIQRAYDILMDEEKRRDYDSQDAPAEEVYPTDAEISNLSEEQFYKVVGDVFRRVSRWSKTKDVPLLGNEKTPISETKEFYKFWLGSFESWRTFKHDDEHDINNAENRDERRWMEKENKKLTKEFKKKEKTSLAEFVTISQKCDFRLARNREDISAKKAAKKEAAAERKKAAEKEAAEAEEKRNAVLAEKEAEEKLKRETAKKVAKNEAQRKKKIAKNFRAACQDFMGGEKELKICTAEHTEILLNDLTGLEIRELTDAMIEKGKAAVFGEYQIAIQRCLQIRENPHKKKNNSSGGAEEKKQVSALAENSEWTLEELSYLAKSTNKFPGGYANRWELIMTDLDHFGVRKSLTDVQNRAIELKKGKKASSVINEEQVNRDIISKVRANQLTADAPSYNTNVLSGDPLIWTPGQMKQLQEGLGGVSKDTKSRFAVISEKYVPGKTEEQCYEKYKSLVQEAKLKKNAAMLAAAELEWTVEQQKQLEGGLKSVPVKDAHRWENIALLVDGKNKKECLARYKELVRKMNEAKK